jgi:hypothetical protein
MNLPSVSDCREKNLKALKHKDLKVPQVAIYTGPGSSHSWIWLVEALERMAFYRMRFVSWNQIGTDLPADVLIVPGGDTYRLAETIGSPRFEQLEQWIVEGGKYVGICAGAYLPLSSSSPPLDRFNIVKSRIRNLTRRLPTPISMEDKFSVQYGCSYVYHPVRGPVVVDFDGVKFVAPLYGGPAWEGRGDAECLCTYGSFNSGTIFLTEEAIARETLIGRPAALRKEYGDGALYLLGPHFEHPDHPGSNGVIGGILLNENDHPFRDVGNRDDHRIVSEVRLGELKRIISNARVTYRGLDGARWRIGCKTWDHEKIGYFVNAIWDRILRAEEMNLDIALPRRVQDGFSNCLTRMRDMQFAMRAGNDATRLAEPLFMELADTSSIFFDSYFLALRSSIEN